MFETIQEATQWRCVAPPPLPLKTHLTDGPSHSVLSVGGCAGIGGGHPLPTGSSKRPHDHIILLSVISFVDLPSAKPDGRSNFPSRQCEDRLNSDVQFAAQRK